MKKHLLALSLLAGALLFVQCGNQEAASDSEPTQEETILEAVPEEADEAEAATEMEATATPAPAASSSAAPAAASQSASTVEKTKSADTKVVNDNAAATDDMSAGSEEAAPTTPKTKLLKNKSAD